MPLTIRMKRNSEIVVGNYRISARIPWCFKWSAEDGSALEIEEVNFKPGPQGRFRSTWAIDRRRSGTMPRKPKAPELLRDLLAEFDSSQLSPAFAARVHEHIAEIGGCAFCRHRATRYCDFMLGAVDRRLVEMHRGRSIASWPL